MLVNTDEERGSLTILFNVELHPTLLRSYISAFFTNERALPARLLYWDDIGFGVECITRGSPIWGGAKPGPGG